MGPTTPTSIQSATGTNTASAGCTEGGGGHLVGIDNQSFCCNSSCGIEVVSWGDLLLVGGNTALVARAYDWREWDKGSPIVTLSPNDRGDWGRMITFLLFAQ